LLAEVIKVHPSPGAWSGLIPSVQRVKYKVRKVLRGQLETSSIEVGYYVVKNSWTADTEKACLSPQIFKVGGSLYLFLKYLPKGFPDGKSYFPPDKNLGIEIVNSETMKIMRKMFG